jgi:hypothetical protein
VLHRLLEEATLRSEAGVREVGVHAAEAVERGVHERLLVVPARDVAAHGKGLLLTAELVGQSLEPVLRTGGEDDAVTELDRAAGGRRADAGAGAGDHENRSVVVRHGR